MLSEVHVVLNGDIFCGALNIDGFAINFIFCIDVWFPCVSLGAVAAHGSKDSARFVNQNRAMDICKNFRRFICQLVEKTSWITYQYEVDSGWLLVPTSGGSVPFQNSSSLGDLGFLEALGMSDPSLPDNAMVFVHHLQPVHSAFVVHVGSDVLLKTVSKIHVLHREEVGFKLGAPAAGGDDNREFTKT